MRIVVIQQPGSVRLLREYWIYLTTRRRWPDLKNDLLIGQTHGTEHEGRYHLFAAHGGTLIREKFGELLANEAGVEEATRRLHSKALEMANHCMNHYSKLLEMVNEQSKGELFTEVLEVSDLTLLGGDEQGRFDPSEPGEWWDG